MNRLKTINAVIMYNLLDDKGYFPELEFTDD